MNETLKGLITHGSFRILSGFIDYRAKDAHRNSRPTARKQRTFTNQALRSEIDPNNLISRRIYYAPSAFPNLLSYATWGRCPRLLHLYRQHCAPLAL
ncbi:MAG: hypothetical protein DMF75_17505 [Acidobacteria bacterium]|nr:MAG: hypothetical protein DMF75_17505 [Acidobacteriota bacterium]